MRPIHLTDLDQAVRTLLALPRDRHPATARAIVAGAGLADRYRKRLRRRHPVWGDGTLAAAARGIGAPVCRVRCDADYRDALALLLVALTGRDPFAIRRDDLYHRDRPAVKERDHGQYTGEGAQDRPGLGPDH